MAKREDLDKILATASSALNKREELQRVLSEKEELETELQKEDVPVESISNLIDKGMLVAKRLLNFGKSDEAALLLSMLLEKASSLSLSDMKEILLEDMLKIVINLVKESLVWETYNKAFLFSIIYDILINYGAETESIEGVSDFDKYLIKIEENSERISSILVQLKNDVTSLTVSPNRKSIEELKEKYVEGLKKLREEKTLGIIINLLNGLARE